MGGKGRRRREKNYRAAHGGPTALPPPPHPSSLEAVPSKLRKIMSFTKVGKSSSNNGAEKNKGINGRITEKKLQSEKKLGSENTTGIRSGSEDGISTAKHAGLDNEIVQNSMHEKKKKRKRKHVNDLRFEPTEELGVSRSKRKERKKRRLEERKKKHKRIREENMDYQARDEVKFGEVVEAPPKLLTVPKAFNTTQDASQERLRLRAVEAYRKRKGWTSRPGVQLPPSAIASELL